METVTTLKCVTVIPSIENVIYSTNFKAFKNTVSYLNIHIKCVLQILTRTAAQAGGHETATVRTAGTSSDA